MSIGSGKANLVLLYCTQDINAWTVEVTRAISHVVNKVLLLNASAHMNFNSKMIWKNIFYNMIMDQIKWESIVVDSDMHDN